MSADHHFSPLLPYLKTLCLLTMGVAWLVLSILLYLDGTSQYGMVIEHETGEWSKGVIVDFEAKQSEICSTGFELVTGMFSGTENYCPSLFGKGYTKGKCSSKKKGTKYGIEPKALKQFDGNYFCVKRDPQRNYHVLSKMRTDGDC